MRRTARKADAIAGDTDVAGNFAAMIRYSGFFGAGFGLPET